MNTIKITTPLLLCLSTLLLCSFSSGLFPTILGYADEVILVFALLILTLNFFTSKKKSRFFFLLWIYLIYSLINSATSRFNPNLFYAFLQALIHMKLFVVAYVSVGLFLASKSGVKIVKNLYFTFIVLFALGIIANYIFGASWNNLLSSEPIQYRYGFIRPAGYFGHYAPNSYFFSIVLITLFMLSTKSLTIDKSVQIRKFYLLILIDFLAAYPLTVRKGLFMIIPYGLYILSLLNPTKRTVFSICASAFIAGFIFFISDSDIFLDTVSNINNFFTDDHAYIRGLIVYYGFSLFSEFFPLGVGNGLYGTYFSNMNLSVYDYVGLNVEALTSQTGALLGVYDSGISAFIAESGFIGLVLATLIIKEFFNYNKRNLDPYNYKVFKIITYFALILSITEPVWQNGFFTTFYTSSLLYIYTKNYRYKINGVWRKTNSMQVSPTLNQETKSAEAP
jgi:hypothetical protein